MSNLRLLRFQDILIARQLFEKGKFFDTALNATGGNAFFENLLRYSQGKLSSYIFEREDFLAMVTLHHPSGPHLARLAHLSPVLNTDVREENMLPILDELARVAGESGTYSISAEVDLDSPEVELFKKAGFAIYARQRIWQREPNPITSTADPLIFIPEESRDVVLAHYDRFIPPIMRGCEPANLGVSEVFQVREQGVVNGLIFVFSGLRGLLVDIYLTNQIKDVRAPLNSILSHVGGAYRKIHLRVRTYAGLPDSVIEEAGFTYFTDQLLMIRHIAARARFAEKQQAITIDNGVIPTIPTTQNFQDSVKGK